MIRRAEEKDVNDIARIRVEGFKNAYKGIISQYYLYGMNIEEEKQKITEIIQGKDEESTEEYYVFVADNANKILGYTTINSDNGLKIKEILQLYVDPNYLKMGIGSKIMTHMKEELLSNNSDNIKVWCLEDNKIARNFYEKHGGKIAEEREKSIGMQSLKEVEYRFKL